MPRILCNFYIKILEHLFVKICLSISFFFIISILIKLQNGKFLEKNVPFPFSLLFSSTYKLSSKSFVESWIIRKWNQLQRGKKKLFTFCKIICRQHKYIECIANVLCSICLPSITDIKHTWKIVAFVLNEWKSGGAMVKEDKKNRTNSGSYTTNNK